MSHDEVNISVGKDRSGLGTVLKEFLDPVLSFFLSCFYMTGNGV